jgi:hypothetical protein
VSSIDYNTPEGKECKMGSPVLGSKGTTLAEDDKELSITYTYSVMWRVCVVILILCMIRHTLY